VSASTNKKALIRRFERESLSGYLNLGSCFQPNGIEIIDLNGALLFVPYAEIKAVCLVRDFAAPDPDERKLFASRPKQPGLWVRLRFKDNDQLDGLLANNLVLQEPYGYSVTPPDPASNNQRIFVPRCALTDLQVLAVIGSAMRREKKPKPEEPKKQISLFD
jgi:hypothetical protein